MPPLTVRVSPEVADLLGAAVVDEILREASAHYRCAACGGAGRGTPGHPPTLLVTIGSGDTLAAGLAHPGCASSGVVVLDRRAAPVVALSAVGLLRAHGADPRPVLALTPHLRILRVTAGGDVQDRLLASLLERGFALLTHPDQPLPAADGLSYTRRWRRLSVTDAADVVLYAGAPGLPPGWVSTARTGGRVGVVIAGGLDPHDPRRDHRADLARAIAAGRAVGASVAARTARSR